jgi:competence ComEA-like helix-hairpin-helix protein
MTTALDEVSAPPPTATPPVATTPTATSPSATIDADLARARARRYAAPALILVPLVLLLYITGTRPMAPQPGTPGPYAASAAIQLDPNTATAAELASLPQLGESTARKIIAYREKRAVAENSSAPIFRTLHDLDSVPGIGPKTLERLAPYLCFPNPD